jgi:D-alanyl-D-alanine carboxypeptidase
MKYILIIISAILLISCRKAQIGDTRSVTIVDTGFDSSVRHPKNVAFTSLLKKYKDRGLPGISLLVNDRNGTWLGAAGKADIGSNIDFMPSTISKVASVTKFFMGSLMFKLFEDSVNSHLGYSSLAMPITTWIPGNITGRIPNGSKVTLGQLMKHESGIPDIIDQDAFYLAVLNNPNKRWTQEELLAFIYNKGALFQPGDTAIYSNTNTILVSMIMEMATGKKHGELLREKIFQPLGLSNTYYQPHDALPNSVAQGYFDLYNNNTLVNVSNIVTGSGNGYGGIYSNLFDLYKFIDAVLLKHTFLSDRSLALMQTYGKTDGSNRYGYGIMKKFIERGDDAGIGHSGRDLGYTCNLFYFPSKGVTQILFVNYGTDAKSNLRDIFYQFQEELLTLTLN